MPVGGPATRAERYAARLLARARRGTPRRRLQATVERGPPEHLPRCLPTHGEGKHAGDEGDRARTFPAFERSSGDRHRHLAEGRDNLARLRRRPLAARQFGDQPLRPVDTAPVHRSIPARVRAKALREMLRITSALRAALPTAQFEEIGDRATMAYGSGGTVQLVREHGAWKIEDFD